MKEEILAAVMFLVRFIEKSETFPRDQLENFKNILTTLLTQRFEKHWFPEVPAKGQGYRCIRVNGLSPVDMTLHKAAVQCGLRYRDLRLPTELTVWVDPNEVCYRLGESEGSYCTLATFPSDSSSSSSASSSPTSPTLAVDKYKKQIRNRMPYELTKYQRNTPFAGTTPVSSLRMRQMGFAGLAPNRPQWRCDRQTYPMPPTPYHYGAANRYMQRNYKNVVTV